MRQWLRRLLIRWASGLTVRPPKQDLAPVVRELGERLVDALQEQSVGRQAYIERCHELFEARQMAGVGPWLPMDVREGVNNKAGSRLRESNPISAQGSFGDLELALQNVEWRREVQLSWVEFTRWGIQQIILISRLYYIKNPIIRRLINVDSYQVFGRGVEISSTDPDLNDAIQDWLKENAVTFGQNALSEHQKRTNYDGNLFFRFFPETQSSGACPCRLIDATEIQDIITNPEDITEEWFFRRTWSRREFDPVNGQTHTATGEEWYPATNYKPQVKQTEINGHPVNWDTPVMHEKFGTVGSWLFGCPCIFPALDWAKADRRYLEACATIAQSLAQFAMMIKTKGGQQALAGVKQQLETTVGPNTAVWDQNRTAVNASIFASGPGTEIAAFHSRAQGLDPNEHRPFATMAAICMDIPPTWIGDMETANLATATTLDRPTELAFLHKQERWKELLPRAVTFAMETQIRAVNGKLREKLVKRFGPDLSGLRVVEAPSKRTTEMGRTFSTYLTEAERKAKGNPKKDNDLEITVTFPAIREGDIPQMITAVVDAMTLGNKGGQVVGIDEKEGVRKLFELAGFENAEEIVEQMYPSTGKNKYDPVRSQDDIPAPISTRPPYSQGGPQDPNGKPAPAPKVATPQEARGRLAEAAKRLMRATRAA